MIRGEEARTSRELRVQLCEGQSIPDADAPIYRGLGRMGRRRGSTEMGGGRKEAHRETRKTVGDKMTKGREKGRTGNRVYAVVAVVAGVEFVADEGVVVIAGSGSSP
jgi:hypothetical protein